MSVDKILILVITVATATLGLIREIKKIAN